MTFCPLHLSYRLENNFSAVLGCSGHRLYISAVMITSKVICDDTYSNKSWRIVGEGKCNLREIN